MNSSKKLVKKIAALLIGFVFLFPFSIFAQDGEALFKNTCGACHTIGKGRLVGPDLSGVTTKRSEEWLLKWVKSSTTFIASGDADAKAIFTEFSSIPMPDVKLSEVEIKAVLTYISGKNPATVAKADAPKVTTAEASAPPVDDGNHALLFENPLMYLYIILFVMVAAVGYSLLNAKRVLERNGKSLNFSLLAARSMAGHSKIISVLFFAIVIAAIYFAIHYGK